MQLNKFSSDHLLKQFDWVLTKRSKYNFSVNLKMFQFYHNSVWFLFFFNLSSLDFNIPRNYETMFKWNFELVVLKRNKIAQKYWSLSYTILSKSILPFGCNKSENKPVLFSLDAKLFYPLPVTAQVRENMVITLEYFIQ